MTHSVLQVVRLGFRVLNSLPRGHFLWCLGIFHTGADTRNRSLLVAKRLPNCCQLIDRHYAVYPHPGPGTAVRRHDVHEPMLAYSQVLDESGLCDLYGFPTARAEDSLCLPRPNVAGIFFGAANH